MLATAATALGSATGATLQGRQVALLRRFLQALEYRQDVGPARGKTKTGRTREAAL